MGGAEEDGVAHGKLKMAAFGVGVALGVLVGGMQIAGHFMVDLLAESDELGDGFDGLTTDMADSSIKRQSRMAKEDNMVR